MSSCPRTRPKPTASKLKSAARTLNLWMATSQTQGAYQRNAQRNLGCLMYPPCASLTAWRARRRWATRSPSRWGGPSPMSYYIPPVVAQASSACGKRLARWRQWAGLIRQASQDVRRAVGGLRPNRSRLQRGHRVRRAVGEPGHACSRHPRSRRDRRLPDSSVAAGKRRWRDHGQRG